MGKFQMWENGQAVDIRCVRPWALHVSAPPANILTTSIAQLVWCSQIMPSGDGVLVDLPFGSKWRELIHEIRFFSHSHRNCVIARRFAKGAKMNLRFKGGSELEAALRFTQKDTGGPACVGFAQEVDGIVFRFRIPEHFSLGLSDSNHSKIRSFRAAYFRYRIISDPRLDGLANYFQRDWLYQIYFSALVARALIKQISLSEANAELYSGNISEEMAKVLNTIFQTISVDEPVIDSSDSPEDPEEQKEVFRQQVHETLLELCRSTEVLEVLSDLARVLWEEPDDEWRKWAVIRFKATLGAALLQAASQLCPQFDAGDLYLDIDPGPRPPHVPPNPEGVEEVWITEATSGGGGVVEEILRRYNEDPRRFFRLAESALGPSDFELVDSELTSLLDLDERDPEVKAIFASVRAANNFEELQRATGRLKNILASKGILLTHPVLSAINARILRPGSSPQSDSLLRAMIQMWKKEEERLGIEIDARVFAYVGSASSYLDQALAHIEKAQLSDLNWRFQVIYGLLWPRGSLVRSQALSTHNPFAPLPETDREILLEMLRSEEKIVCLEEPDWRLKVADALSQFGIVRLYASTSLREDLKKALLDLAVQPLDIGFLHLYPRVEGLQRDKNGFYATLDIREAIQ